MISFIREGVGYCFCSLCLYILSGVGFTSNFALDRLYILGRRGLINVE